VVSLSRYSNEINDLDPKLAGKIGLFWLQLVAERAQDFRHFPTAPKFSMQPTCNQMRPRGHKKEPAESGLAG
jgi:hypothetical protein